MIPIIYESNETQFTSNGLGRLQDVISCEVVEERNGIYELEFQYPISGRNYDLITLGRIVAVTHDDSGDVQPFDLVSVSRPIDGIVTFKGVHISYRLNKITIGAVGAVDWNTLINTVIGLGAKPTIEPFRISTDTPLEGTIPAFKGGAVTSVRQILGGVEGSVLDTFGGEFEFDKFQVNLYRSRGEQKDYAIRYGLNMVDYNESIDYSATFNKCVPYWVGDEVIVMGDEVDSGVPPFNGIDNCVPLDLTDRFENKPTKSKLNQAALSYMAANKTYNPAHNIQVDFIRLQDSPEYERFASLLTCKLCDQIKVIFPRYNTEEYFKIVRVSWDPLKERYNSMELGDLQTSLSEALGIGEGSNPLKVELIRERHTVFSAGDVTVNAGSNKEDTYTVTKPGYMALGVVGWSFGGTGRANMDAGTKLRISNVSEGTCDVDIYMSNNGASNWAGSLYIDILWRKL